MASLVLTVTRIARRHISIKVRQFILLTLVKARQPNLTYGCYRQVPILSLLSVPRSLSTPPRQATYRVHVRTLWLGPAVLSLITVPDLLLQIAGPPPIVTPEYSL